MHLNLLHLSVTCGLRNSLGYFSHVKYFTIDIDIDIMCILFCTHNIHILQ